MGPVYWPFKDIQVGDVGGPTTLFRMPFYSPTKQTPMAGDRKKQGSAGYGRSVTQVEQGGVTRHVRWP